MIPLRKPDSVWGTDIGYMKRCHSRNSKFRYGPRQVLQWSISFRPFHDNISASPCTDFIARKEILTNCSVTSRRSICPLEHVDTCRCEDHSKHSYQSVCEDKTRRLVRSIYLDTRTTYWQRERNRRNGDVIGHSARNTFQDEHPNPYDSSYIKPPPFYSSPP